MIKKNNKLSFKYLAMALLVQSVCLTGLGLFNCSAGYASNSNPARWMTELSDSKKLTELSIPGTHDSGARYGGFAAVCQEKTIDEQLAMGVRFLDIRCRYYEDGFPIHHGPMYQHLNFQDVMNSCKNFLASNPGEVVIMSIKEEYSNDNAGFENRFDRYVAENPNVFYQPNGRWSSAVPALGEARGKVVLFRRFKGTQEHSGIKGINAENWAENTSFTINNDHSTIRVQDVYNTSEKWPHFQPFLEEAKAGDLNTLFVNFSSGYKKDFVGLPHPWWIYEEMNPKMGEYFGINKSGRYGIIPMDFVDEGRVNSIIETNF